MGTPEPRLTAFAYRRQALDGSAASALAAVTAAIGVYAVNPSGPLSILAREPVCRVPRVPVAPRPRGAHGGPGPAADPARAPLTPRGPPIAQRPARTAGACPPARSGFGCGRRRLPHPALNPDAWPQQDGGDAAAWRTRGSQEERALNVLVSAASRHGATIEVAATIGEALRSEGLEVFVVAPDEVDRLDGFDAAVLGSAVYVGRWLEPARDLVERHKVALTRIPVWLFSSGPIGDPLKPAEDAADAAPLAALVGARGHHTFPGSVDRRRLSFGERAVMAAVRAPEGDYRTWPEIEAWAREIAVELACGHSSTASRR